LGIGLRQVTEVFLAALRLGLTSFGGPNAHFAYFRQEYVVRRRWLDDGSFSELLAVTQALPGPSSSQLGMAIGHLRAGWFGAIAAWAGFTLPSAFIMILLGWWWDRTGPELLRLTHGLLLVAVAVVAQAAGQLYRSQCKTFRLGITAWTAFGALLLIPGPWTLPAVLVIGASAGAATAPSVEVVPPLSFSQRRRSGVAALLLFLGLAILLPWLRSAFALDFLAWTDAFYRTGSWIFGGGHVVLPWLNREVVGPGWVSADAFLAGYGAAQALPGPLFSVAAFLGMIAGGLPGALIALVAIFLPGFLLIGGVLPFWSRLRVRRRWRGAFAGASAAVVGLLASTLISPLGSALARPGDWVVAAGLFLLLAGGRCPVWAVVLLGALAGPLVLLLR